MAIPKTITVSDISKDGDVVISQEGTALRFVNNYHCLDAAGQKIPDIRERSSVTAVEWSALPQGIQTALMALRNHLYGLNLQKEGMA